MFLNLLNSLEGAAQAHPVEVYGPLVNLGAVGVCLIALAFYYRVKDNRYEERIDERIKREAEFSAKYIELVEKQHTITEKFSATLDIVVSLLKNQQKT